MKKYLDIFVSFLVETPKADDSTVLEHLLKNDITESIAVDIITFTPTAFNRMVFDDSGIKFSDYYIIKNGREENTFQFTDNEVFSFSQKYYIKYIVYKFEKEDVIKIIGRCSEFDAIIQAIEQGLEFKDLRINPMLLIYD